MKMVRLIDFGNNCSYNYYINVATNSRIIMQVSVRELKNHLSKYLNQREEIIVTSHKVAVAKLIPIASVSTEHQDLWFEGVIWNGKKPSGGKNRPKVKGDKTIADYLLEDRR